MTGDFVTSAYFRPTSASGSDAGSPCKNGGSNAGCPPVLAEVSFSASAKSLLFNEFLAEVGGSRAEVNPRTPLLLLPPPRNCSSWEVVRNAQELDATPLQYCCWEKGKRRAC